MEQDRSGIQQISGTGESRDQDWPNFPVDQRPVLRKINSFKKSFTFYTKNLYI
jgi:hypothetical protein